MPLEQPEAGYQWSHVPLREARDVVVVGEPHSWWAHWTGGGGARGNRAVRCLAREGEPCAWCVARQSPACRYVLPVWLIDYDPETREPSFSELRVLELGKPQYSILVMLDKEGGLVGRRLRLVRERPKLNATIQVRPIGREHVSDEARADIADFVRNLGRSELAVARAPVAATGVSPELVGDRARAADQRVINPRPKQSRNGHSAEEAALEIEWGIPSGG